MKINLIGNAILGTMLLGCQTPPAETPVETETTQVERAAVIAGVARGFAGACPGADVDAKMQAGWLQDGRPVAVLVDEAATIAGAKKAILDAVLRLEPEGLLTLGFSGHGTLRARRVDAETLGPNEGGLCFYDGVWWASEIAAWVRENIPPIRIEYFADCCHAEGNWRAFARVATFGMVSRPAPVAIRLDAPKGWAGQMVQWAGCRQNDYSYGDATGGTWTQTLNRHIRAGLTRLELFEVARGEMPPEQTPMWSEYRASEEFKSGRVLQ